MEENDKRITKAGGEMNFLIDSSVYHDMNDIESRTGYHPLDLIVNYPKVKFFFTQSMINENVRGRMGFTDEAVWMFQHSLQDEGSFSGKESRFLYNDKDGNVRTITMHNISGEDYNQILVAQNHQDLVLVTNDHKVLKSGGALLSSRIADLPNLIQFFARETHDNPRLKAKWEAVERDYTTNGHYSPPKTLSYIEDLDRKPNPLTGEIPDLKPILTKKPKKNKQSSSGPLLSTK